MQRPLVGAETYDQAVSAASTPMLGHVPCKLKQITSNTCIEALPASDWCDNCQSLWEMYGRQAVTS